MGLIELNQPFIITARLLPGVRVGDSYISIKTNGRNREGRTEYVVYFDTPEFEYTDSTLCSGCQGGDFEEGMESLLSFLMACVESGEDGDNTDLFPAHVREWAEEHVSDLQILQMDIECLM